MKDSSNPNSNLRRAGWLLVFEIAAACLVAYQLSRSNISIAYVPIGIWLFNLLPAWYIAMAARDFEKNPWLHGLASALLPAIAISAWYWLKLTEMWKAREFARNQNVTRRFTMKHLATSIFWTTAYALALVLLWRKTSIAVATTPESAAGLVILTSVMCLLTVATAIRVLVILRSLLASRSSA